MFGAVVSLLTSEAGIGLLGWKGAGLLSRKPRGCDLMTMPLADWNGQQMPLADVRVPALDRAFLFGDGVYEVIRVANGQLFLANEHFERLRYSLGELRIPADVKQIESRARQTLSAARLSDALIYIQVTRGTAPRRTHAFPSDPVEPNVLIFAEEYDTSSLEALKQRGGRAVLMQDIRWKRCDIKSVNLLGNVLAAQAAVEADCDEAIFLNESGLITEGAHTSVFGVHQGEILTAPLQENVLPGITRALISRIAGECGIPLRNEPLRHETLYDLDELFLTGTTVDVLGITSVDNKHIGGGQVGPVTRKLEQAYQAALQSATR